MPIEKRPFAAVYRPSPMEVGLGPESGEPERASAPRRLPTVLLPAYRRAESTRRTLLSLREAGAPPVVLVDDEGASGPGERAAFVSLYPGLEILATERPVYWTGAIALAARQALAAGAESVLFFNQDVTVLPGYFERLVDAADRHPGALVGSAVLYLDDPARVWSAGGGVEWWLRGNPVLHHGAAASSLPAGAFDVKWLFGMGTLVPRSVFERVGFPDGGAFPMAWGDFDFSVRARTAGLRLVVEPRARLVHDVGTSDARIAGAPSLALYRSWMADPHHNLSLATRREVWRRHGPRGAWRAALACHVAFLWLNWVRMRLLFPPPRAT